MAIVIASSLGSGHSDLRRHTEQQIELLRFMKRRYPQVSWELILSAAAFDFA